MRRFERIYDVVEPVEEYPMEAITQYTSTMYSTIGTRSERSWHLANFDSMACI